MELESSLPHLQKPATYSYNTYVVFLNKYSIFDPNKYRYWHTSFFLICHRFLTMVQFRKAVTCERLNLFRMLTKYDRDVQTFKSKRGFFFYKLLRRNSVHYLLYSYRFVDVVLQGSCPTYCLFNLSR